MWRRGLSATAAVRFPRVLERRRGLADEAAVAAPHSAQSAVATYESLKPGQLKKHFVASAVPMIGFGFMDNSVMLHAGNAIDLTLGVTFGLSTLAAAACGQACSDVAGVLFGGFVEGFAKRMGLPEPGFTPEEENLPVVKRVEVAGGVIGVFSGCCMGLLNLFIIDTNVAKQMKLSAKGKDGQSEFQIRLCNEERPGSTAIHIDGPGDVDGILASVTTAMAVYGCTIREMDGERGNVIRKDDGASTYGGFRFSFWVQQDGNEVEDDQLDDLGSAILAAAKEPANIRVLAVEHAKLQDEHAQLEDEASFLEHELEKHLLTVTRRRSTQ
mmetsp:Transcript_33078/g.77376  ORF Transcript_33078/g.77376 Transcript_33078/m.77376 type:complete len:327 (-) Transcript_33078:48-1028(-)